MDPLPPPRHGRGSYTQSNASNISSQGNVKNIRKRKHGEEASVNNESSENDSRKRGKQS